MAYAARMGKRIYATDGSAFFTCSICQRSIPVALHEMHKQECRLNHKRQLLRSRNERNDRDRKKRARKELGFEHHKQLPSSPILISDDDVELARPRPPSSDELAVAGNPNPPFRSGGTIGKVDLDRMPRSAFRIFMESYEEECGLDDWFEIDRTGVTKWKMMSKEERKPYVDREKELDLEYMRTLKSELRLDGSDSGLQSSSSVNKAFVYKKPCR